MKRKAMASILATVTSLSMVLTACGGGAANNAGTTETSTDSQQTEAKPAESASSGSGSTIRLVNNKAEIQEGLQKLVAKYKEETGVLIIGPYDLEKKGMISGR